MKPSRLKHGHFHDVWYKHGWMCLELSHPHCHGQNLCGWWIPTKPIGSSCHQQIWLNHTYSTYSIKPFQRWSFCTFCFVAIWIGTCVKPKALWWCEQWSQIFTQWLSGPRKCIQQISERTVGSKTNTQHLGQQIINIFALLTTKSDWCRSIQRHSHFSIAQSPEHLESRSMKSWFCRSVHGQRPQFVLFSRAGLPMGSTCGNDQLHGSSSKPR